MCMLQNIRQLVPCQSNNVQKSSHATCVLSFYVFIHACRFSPVCYAALAHVLKIISVHLRTPLIVNKLFCCKDKKAHLINDQMQLNHALQTKSLATH